MKIYDDRDNVFNAVDEVLARGVVAIEGTKTPATNYAKRVIQCLEPYSEVSPIVGYQNVPNAGYLYYVMDTNRFSIGSDDIKELIYEIDASNPHSEQ